jgi:hypothetical protein
MNNNKYILLLIFEWLSLLGANSYAQLSLVSEQEINFSNAVTTLSSGDWSDPSIWNSNSVPNATTDVIINDEHSVYIDVQGSSSNEIVDLCRNLQVKPTAVLRMGHDTDNFAKDLRINGSILCNGTFSAGRNQPTDSGDGLIYTYNSRIYLNLTHDNTYISGSGFFNPRSLSISSTTDKNIFIDLYNTVIDDNFAVKSNNRVNVTISHFAYVRIKGTLGLTGSSYKYSSPTAKSDLTIHGIVVTEDVSLFTKNTSANGASSIVIENQGSLYTKKINNRDLGVKTKTGGFSLLINTGGLLRLGQRVEFDNLTANNPHFSLVNNGEIRSHYSETLSASATITSSIDANDPNTGADVSQIKEIFGSSHIAGWYNFTNRPYLLEGLDKYKEFGATSIKTTLTASNGKMESAYPFNHEWPTFQTLKQVAQNEYIDSLFQRTHIKTHTFWTTTRNKGDFKKGPDFDHTSYVNEEQQFYDLTKHLLETYASMHKTFVYQNWEGDWMLRGQGVLWERDPSLIPGNIEWTIEGMARMFRARQRGTERARNEIVRATAKVFHGIEFNKLWWNDNGTRKTMMDSEIPSVIADVVSKTRLDLTSWSAYDGGWTNNENPEGHAMWKGLEIARYFTTQTGDLDAEFPVQIGEFAINENPPYNGNNTQNTIENRYKRYVGVALGLGIQNFYLWNLYCSGQQGAPDGHTWEKGIQYEPSLLYEYMDGKWLLEPDGSWGHAASYLMNLWGNTLHLESTKNSKIEITLYPNPVSKSLKIKGIDERSILTFFDVSGRVLKKVKYKKEGIDVKRFNKGIYMLLIEGNNNNYSYRKFIIN